MHVNLNRCLRGRFPPASNFNDDHEAGNTNFETKHAVAEDAQNRHRHVCTTKLKGYIRTESPMSSDYAVNAVNVRKLASVRKLAMPLQHEWKSRSHGAGYRNALHKLMSKELMPKE